MTFEDVIRVVGTVIGGVLILLIALTLIGGPIFAARRRRSVKGTKDIGQLDSDVTNVAAETDIWIRSQLMGPRPLYHPRNDGGSKRTQPD